MPKITEARRIRDKLGLTRREMEALTAIGYSTLAMWESGEREPSRAASTLYWLLEWMYDNDNASFAELLREYVNT